MREKSYHQFYPDVDPANNNNNPVRCACRRNSVQNVIEATNWSMNEFKLCSTMWNLFLILLTEHKPIADEVLGLMGKPSIIILFNVHSNKLSPNFLSLYPPII